MNNLKHFLHKWLSLLSLNMWYDKQTFDDALQGPHDKFKKVEVLAFQFQPLKLEFED